MDREDMTDFFVNKATVKINVLFVSKEYRESTIVFGN